MRGRLSARVTDRVARRGVASQLMDAPAEILRILDQGCRAFTFPMLDNGYVYLAATRLSAHRSLDDWALVLEVFGFSPRSGLPDTFVTAFGSRNRRQRTPGDFLDGQSYDHYVAAHPHDDSSFFFPIGQGGWQEADGSESVNPEARTLTIRRNEVAVPDRSAYSRLGIELSHQSRIQVYELCRYLAATHRDEVLATPEERSTNVMPELVELLVLDEWNHPDVAAEQLAGGSETFQQLAEVLVTGDVSRYSPTLPPNTDWHSWPDGGTL